MRIKTVYSPYTVGNMTHDSRSGQRQTQHGRLFLSRMIHHQLSNEKRKKNFKNNLRKETLSFPSCSATMFLSIILSVKTFPCQFLSNPTNKKTRKMCNKHKRRGGSACTFTHNFLASNKKDLRKIPADFFLRLCDLAFKYLGDTVAAF